TTSVRSGLPPRVVKHQRDGARRSTLSLQIYRTACAPPSHKRRGRLAASRTYRDGTFACSCEWLRAIGPGPAIRPSVRRHCWEERTYLRCFAIWLRGADWSTGCLMDPSRGGRSFGSTSFLSYTTKRGGELGIPCRRW